MKGKELKAKGVKGEGKELKVKWKGVKGEMERS